MNSSTDAGIVCHLSREQVLHWRLARHHLIQRSSPRELTQVVGSICGLHAQLMSSAELSAWARIDGLDRNAVHDALWKHRTLVKLWAMRGTVHLLPAAEIGMWLSALGTNTKYGNTGHPEIEAICDATERALKGRLLTRCQLAREVEEFTGSKEYAEYVLFSWGSYLKAASFRGLICFAPNEGANVRFTSPATWVPGGISRPSAGEGISEVTRRFLSAYAPATTKGLGLWWGGYGHRQGERMLATLGEEVVEVDVEGERGWMLAQDVQDVALSQPSDTAKLLPAFDPWVAGASRDSTMFIDPDQRPRVYRNQGWFSPVMLVNGRMAGVWKHARKGRRLLVEMESFHRLSGWAREQLEDEAERLSRFLGGELSVKWLI